MRFLRCFLSGSGLLMYGVLSLAMITPLDVSARKSKPVEVDTAIYTRQATELQEVVIRPKKQKYSKKNNPAVDLMRRIRDSRQAGNPTTEPYYSYDQYDKMILGINDFDVPRNPGKKTAFLKEYLDTAAATGRQVLNISLKEKNSTVLTREASSRQVVRAERSVGIDQSLNQENIRKILEDILREIDIYGNDITLMQNRFVSPLSNIAADYYKFTINDTVEIDNRKYVELGFTPHSPESFSFNGRLYVDPVDSTCFIRRVTMRVPRVINLNYIDNIYITQEFEQDSLGKRHKVLDDITLDLQILPGTPVFYGHRETHYRNFSYEPREDLKEYYDATASLIDLTSEIGNPPEWKELRFVELTAPQANMEGMHERMKQLPLFFWGEKIVRILAQGYVGTSRNGAPSKFDIGPLNTFISFGDVEGIRLRFGGITTANLSRHWFARGYVAYGTKDRKWKYKGEVEYSFNEKKYHSREFPMNGIRLTHEYDLDRIGQHYLFTNPDNIFLSLKRMKSILTTYRRLSTLEYNLELPNHFSLCATLRNEIQEATRWVRFRKVDGSQLKSYSQSTLSLQLRYAPGESFAQFVSTRAPINMDAPVFMLTHEFGPAGILGNRWTVNKTEFSFQKRFWFSSFGYLDALLKTGIAWSAVPFPSLPWANSNLSYTIQPESFSLLNPMEFANDRYASIDLTYWVNGALFNRIPLLKKLKWREIISFKALTGDLSNRNNPALNPELLQFPEEGLCRKMGRKPYMEIGAGIDNILTILRVDYIWRLTYRDTPGAPDSGLRVSLHFSF